ncbi:hypothetical protein VTO73DRAFT_13243 [Trametes versicolor]
MFRRPSLRQVMPLSSRKVRDDGMLRCRFDAQDVASVTMSVFWLQLIANRYVDVHTGPRSVGLSTLPVWRTESAPSGERGVTGSLVPVSAGYEHNVPSDLYGMLLNSAASVHSNTSCRVASSLTKLRNHPFICGGLPPVRASVLGKGTRPGVFVADSAQMKSVARCEDHPTPPVHPSPLVVLRDHLRFIGVIDRPPRTRAAGSRRQRTREWAYASYGGGHSAGPQRGSRHWPRRKYETAPGTTIRCEAQVPPAFCDTTGTHADHHDAEIRGFRHDLPGRK